MPTTSEGPPGAPAQTSTTQRTTLFFYLLMMGGVLTVFFEMVAPYLLTLLMAVILAVLLYPFHVNLRRRGLTPTRSAALLTTSTFLLGLLPLTVFAVAAARQSIEVIDALSSRSRLSYQAVLDWLFQFQFLTEYLGSPDDIKGRLGELAGKIIGAASSAGLSLAGQVPDATLQLVLALFAAYFFLIDGKDLMRWLGERTPLAPNVRKALYLSFQESAVSVFVASMAAAAAQAVLMLVSFAALSVPGAMLAAGATFIFAWLPLVGSIPVWGVGVAYLYLQGSVAKATIMLVCGLLTSVADNVVRPLVMRGSSQEMHPLLSLVAIFGGLAMFGIVGVFIGPILAALLVSILAAWPEVARESGIELDVLKRLNATASGPSVLGTAATARPGEVKSEDDALEPASPPSKLSGMSTPQPSEDLARLASASPARKASGKKGRRK